MFFDWFLSHLLYGVFCPIYDTETELFLDLLKTPIATKPPLNVCLVGVILTVEVRMEKPVGLHGSRLRPIPGEKVKLGYRASKCRKTDRESLTWK